MFWDILICSIAHRNSQLTQLLTHLERQLAPGVGIRVYRDNLEAGYGAKCQRLLDSSAAEYVCFIDDDDMVAPDYVARVVTALESQPDYVGFCVRYTEDGEPQVPVTHSLRYRGWENLPDLLTRDLVHFNPIRREHALRAQWAGGNGADRAWADELRALGCVQREVFLPLPEMYYYQHTTHDTFCAPREPLPDLPARPEHPRVVWVS